MTPDATASATAQAVSEVAAGFMLDMDTYARGGELGFDGLDFYTAGRAGVLGAVPADVVVATFVFWTPETIRASWARGLEVMGPLEASDHYIAVAHAWAEEHISTDVDLARLAALLGTMVEGAPVAGAPLCAAWRARPEPDADRTQALVLHRMQVLRELRGGLHGGAVLAHGITPHEAVTIRSPHMLGLFGYEAPAEIGDDVGLHARWADAEAATDRAMAPAYAVLDANQRTELRELLDTLTAAL